MYTDTDTDWPAGRARESASCTRNCCFGRPARARGTVVMPAAVPPATGSQRTKRESALAGGGGRGSGLAAGRPVLAGAPHRPPGRQGRQGKAGRHPHAPAQHSTAPHPNYCANFTTLHVPLSFHRPLASVEALSFALLLLAWPDCPACLAFSLRSLSPQCNVLTQT